MSEIDKIDRKIIDFLCEDGRMSSAEIARALGCVSERAVRYRIDHLIKEGIIKVSAIVNPKALGYHIVADVWLEVESGLIAEIARQLICLDSISYVAYDIGKTDLSIQIIARDTEEVHSLITEVIGKIPGVRKTTTSIVPVILKDVYQWRVPSDK